MPGKLSVSPSQKQYDGFEIPEEMELLKGNVSGTGTSKEETLVEKFARSKSGWRQKQTTALRQERQLKNLFEEAETRILLDNYQRSGTIKNATMAQYE
ncbi:hypothetical protein FJT64_021705 [Amphibalanus amphitrite]|uniref:Uncharacterized protein n=1 Tax=Amphibalanus amphitrite TaxID=1232801 RepID=A0A6A4WL84_AMPAM|nr:hypothetical protein FJT64_021705 [Amphibalanus amphitrite]